MANSPKSNGSNDEDDIRVALKLPGRGSNENRQIATAFKKIKQALRSSSGGGGGRTGVSSRQRGSAAAGSAVAKAGGKAGAMSGALAAKVKPLQRVAVRWTYSKNQGDGQWAAHGKYIERESAQDKELDKERGDPQLDQQSGRELDEPTINPKEKESDHERADQTRSSDERYANAGHINDPGRVSALRQSHAAALAEKPPTKSLNNLRSLSGLGVVRFNRGREGVLPGDALGNLVERGTEHADGVRRRSGGQPGTDRAADRPVKRAAPGFGSGGEKMAIAETLESWQKGGDERMFKLIISPEFGERMNLKKHVSDLVRQMEKDLGTKLEWVAVDHHNTDHPHAHVAIRGIDDRGRVLEVSPEYIAQGSRIRAQELATRELGYRSDRDVADALDRQVSQQRFTDIDRTLLKAGNEQGSPNVDAGILKAAQANKNREVDYSSTPPADQAKRATRLAQVERLAFLEQHGLTRRVGEMKWWVSPELATRKPDGEKIIRFEGKPPENERARESRLVQIRRLAQLTEMGLAEKVGNLSWRLKPTMESALRQMQISQDRLKTKFAHREMISDPSAPLVATELKQLGQRVAGRVVGTGLNEATNRSYILVEGFDGKVHYLNQAPKVQKMRGEGELNAGEYVSLEVVERKDRAGKVVGTMQKIERHGRAIPPALLDAEIMKGGKVIEPPVLKKTVAGAFREAAAARLGRLQAAGAVDISDGQVRHKSLAAHDRLTFEDAGIRTVDFDGKGAMLATVLARGQDSIAVAPTYGRKQLLTTAQLQDMGTQARFLNKDASIFIGVDSKGKMVAAVIKADQVPAMVQDQRASRLDSMLRQLQPIQLANHPLGDAVRERAEVWTARGVDPIGKEFSLKANMWRKGAELQEAAKQKGVDTVLEGLSIQLGKPVKELDCETGRQVSGRVLVVAKEDGHTTVVLDTGRELTKLKVADPMNSELKPGDKMRAKAEQVKDANDQRRVMTWRFADLEREEARKKGLEGKAF